MTTIIQQALDDGVVMALTATGQIEVTGAQTAIERWLPTIREHKIDILSELKTDPAVLAILEWIAADKLDAISCGQTYCGDCKNYRRHDRTCAAKKCPTPLTLYRRCDLYKAT